MSEDELDNEYLRVVLNVGMKKYERRILVFGIITAFCFVLVVTSTASMLVTQFVFRVQVEWFLWAGSAIYMVLFRFLYKKMTECRSVYKELKDVETKINSK
jgi:predicted tellurium resistance membrane protein TerC